MLRLYLVLTLETDGRPSGANFSFSCLSLFGDGVQLVRSSFAVVQQVVEFVERSGLVGQVGRRLPNVEFASDHVGNQAGAKFPQEIDLTAGTVGYSLYASNTLINCLGDLTLLLWRGHWDKGST